MISFVLLHVRVEGELVSGYRKDTFRVVPVYQFRCAVKVLASLANDILSVAQEVKIALPLTHKFLTTLVKHTVQRVVGFSRLRP